jgi:NADPH:quinone reductase-like Zn-dependent oxidoreductase
VVVCGFGHAAVDGGGDSQVYVVGEPGADGRGGGGDACDARVGQALVAVPIRAGSGRVASGRMAQMRAVVAETADGPDGLVVREVPRPEPRPGWALVRVEAFGLNRSEYKTLKGYAGDAVTFPRILGIEMVGVVEAVHGDAPAVPPGETVAALMGGMGPVFDGGYAEYALVPEHQLIALDTTLPWDVLGALPETFVTAAGSLEHLDLEEGKTLLLRGATSSVGLACLELARAAGVRVIATTP